MYEIVQREQFSETTFLWQVRAPDVARAAQPGHFIILRLREGGERIPLTIADFDRERGTITLVVQAIGKSTREMLRGYRAGDRIADFAGPLGLASEIERVGHVVLVGGGLGVAPIFPQLRAFKQAGNRTTAIIGFRSRELVFWEQQFRPFCDELVVCTDDGSYGRAGLVTAALADALRGEPAVDRVVAVGPLPMMQACAEVARPHDVPTVVSLNAIMVDGTGMCGSCRVTVGGDIRFACVDGPEFDALAVDFNELMIRQRRFKRQELRADEDFDHVCNLERQLFEQEKRNYKKIKALPPRATPMPERPAAQRARTFDEVNLGYSLTDAITEAERCIQCARPTCISGCPVGIDIPRFIRYLLVRDLDGALGVIHENNLFPSVCGRVCPQESQCEAQCVIGRKVEPVAIGRLERFVGDHAQAAALVPAADAGHLGRVAIVGSGPAGLACAADLAKAGAKVTVFEALHAVGGVLAYGIPSFRLPREIIAREVDSLKRLGVEIETNKVIGKTFTVDQMLEEKGFDALFIGTGAGYPVFLNIPGEFAGRVYSANEFLTRINLMGGDAFPFEDTPVDMGKSVVVLGAGNTAMDCLRVARRIGAEQVRCLYRRSEAEAPARAEELRHAMEEGIDFQWLRSPVEIKVDDAGDVQGIVCQKMELGPPDASGRRRPQPIAGELETFACDTVIYALGTRANPIISQSSPELQTHHGGYLTADPLTQATNRRGVFAGGDIVTGGATVILAMGAGRRAARAMACYLRERVWPPTLERQGGGASTARGLPVVSLDASAERSCPKCRRPIEGDEEYLCCADARLSWRCGGCGKVSEGFAYPYGLCPSCGGALEAEHAPDASGPEAQQAIRRAFEIELGGQAFYRRGAEVCSDAEVRELFERLAAMEHEHMQTLTRRYHVQPPALDALPTLSQVAVYAGQDPPADDGVALLELAVGLECRARDFFAEQRALLAEGSAAHGLYLELEAEEQEHVDLLQTELERLQRSRPGLLTLMTSAPGRDSAKD